MIRRPGAETLPRQLSLFPDPDSTGRPAPPAAPGPVSRVPLGGGPGAVRGAAPRPAPAAAGERGELRDRLNRLLGGRLRELVLTDNRSRILTARPAGGRDPHGLELRLDRCFADAPPAVLAEVAAFCLAAGGRRGAERRRRALAAIRDHFEVHRSRRSDAPASRRAAPLQPRGERFDLAEIRDRLNRRWFEGRLASGITWGRDRAELGRVAWGCRRRRSTIQLGSYSHEDDLIRVHPALDRRGVPEYVVAAVVFHELLHAALPPAVHNGRRILHGAEFRRRERQYPDHARAERWIAANLGSLLRRR